MKPLESLAFVQTDTDTQTHRHTDTDTDRHRQTHRHTHIHTHAHTRTHTRAARTCKQANERRAAANCTHRCVHAIKTSERHIPFEP